MSVKLNDVNKNEAHNDVNKNEANNDVNKNEANIFYYRKLRQKKISLSLYFCYISFRCSVGMKSRTWLNYLPHSPTLPNSVGMKSRTWA